LLALGLSAGILLVQSEAEGRLRAAKVYERGLAPIPGIAGPRQKYGLTSVILLVNVHTMDLHMANVLSGVSAAPASEILRDSIMGHHPPSSPIIKSRNSFGIFGLIISMMPPGG
jgi:hypothetical protein